MSTLHEFTWNFTIMCGNGHKPAFIKVFASDLINAKEMILAKLKTYFNNVSEYQKLCQKRFADYERHVHISKFVNKKPLSRLNFLLDGEDGQEVKNFWENVGISQEERMLFDVLTDNDIQNILKLKPSIKKLKTFSAGFNFALVS